MNPHPDQVKAGKILASTLTLARLLCQEPIDGLELDRQLEQNIRDQGGEPALKGYQPPFTPLIYQHAVCLSLNNEIVHGPPRSREVTPDDLITVDLVVKVGEWHADGARTFSYADKHRDFMARCHLVFLRATSMISSNMPISDYSRAAEAMTGALQLEIVKEFCGHGIGTEIHAKPQIYNFDNLSTDRFEIGKSYAVEPIFAERPYEIAKHPDGWTVEANCLTAHFEDTFFIGDKCIMRLTKEDT